MIRRVVAPALAVLLVLGCQMVSGPEPEALDGTAWNAVAIGGVAPVAGAQPWIRFDGDNQLSGSSGCNSFGGGFGRIGDRFNVGEIAATERACAGAVGEQERRFFDALFAAERIQLGIGTLRLSGPKGDLDFVSG